MADLCAALVKGIRLAALEERRTEQGDVNWKDINGSTPLMYAISDGSVEDVEWLLNHEANLEATQRDGSTILHVMASEDKRDMLIWLKSQGLRPVLEKLMKATRIIDGKDAHQVALEHQHHLFARQLEELLLPSSSQVSDGLPEPPLPSSSSSSSASSAAAAPPTAPPSTPACICLLDNKGIGNGSLERQEQQDVERPSSSSSSAAIKSDGRSTGVGNRIGGGGGGFEIAGAWSVAGVGTCIQIKHRSYGLHIALDMGTSAGEALGANHVFISHSHIDHIGALLNHARARTLSNKPAKYYVPVSAVESLLQAKTAYEALDGCEFQCEIIGVQPRDSIRIHPNVKCIVFPTLHRVPSQGYAFIRGKSKGLKAEYKDLPPKELALVRKQGLQVVEIEEIVEVTYTGDTVIDPLLDEDLVKQAKLLIMECTYLEGDVTWSHKWCHIHLQEIISNSKHFENNETIILNHVSRKYKGAENVLRLFLEGLAACPTLLAKIGVTLRGFGRAEDVTYLEDELCNGLQLSSQQEYGQGLVGGDGSRLGRGGKEGQGRRREEEDGLEEIEVKTQEEAARLLRVMSEDMGMRPDIAALRCEGEGTDDLGGKEGGGELVVIGGGEGREGGEGGERGGGVGNCSSSGGGKVDRRRNGASVEEEGSLSF